MSMFQMYFVRDRLGMLGWGLSNGVLGSFPRGGGEHFHMFVDTDCLSFSPLFYVELTQQPFFFYICKEFDIKIFKVLHVLHVFGLF